MWETEVVADSRTPSLGEAMLFGVVNPKEHHGIATHVLGEGEDSCCIQKVAFALSPLVQSVATRSYPGISLVSTLMSRRRRLGGWIAKHCRSARPLPLAFGVLLMETTDILFFSIEFFLIRRLPGKVDFNPFAGNKIPQYV